MILSIVIPVYNAEKHLNKTLESLLKIKTDSVEFICVNDGSSDKSGEILRKYAEKDNRIHILSQNNSGVSIARNKGLMIAEGEFITFLDADDIICAETVDDFIRNIDKVADIYFFDDLYNMQGKKRLLKKSSVIYNNIENVRYEVIYTGKINMCWGKIYVTDTIKSNKILFPVNVKIGEDKIFLMRYLYSAKTCAYIDKCLVMYNIHGDSAMDTFFLERFDDQLEIFCEKQKYASNENIVATELKEFGNLLAYSLKVYTPDEVYNKLNTNKFHEYYDIISRSTVCLSYKYKLIQQLLKRNNIRNLIRLYYLRCKIVEILKLRSVKKWILRKNIYRN